jgi:hypothetical protein
MPPASANPNPAWWIVPLALVSFPLFWLLLIAVIARVGGWTALARACPARSRPRGQAFHGLSLQIGPATSYGGCITAVYSPEGLYLVPFFLFRCGHPPLMIPWSQVGAPVERRVLGFRTAHLPLSIDGRSARLGLPRKVRAWLEDGGSGGDWRPKLEPAAAPAAATSPFKRPTAWRGH